jgi:hypothetical protein
LTVELMPRSGESALSQINIMRYHTIQRTCLAAGMQHCSSATQQTEVLIDEMALTQTSSSAPLFHLDALAWNRSGEPVGLLDRMLSGLSTCARALGVECCWLGCAD